MPCDVEHTCSDNVPGTTTERLNLYNPHLHTLSACRPVLRLNTNSFYYLGITNDDFQQDRCSRNLPFSAIYRKTA
ncbi:hypothetical protein TNCV_3094401 [Trichonephila clavipes]|nr:hypothetical protein TNCV_3094401 [Trichonephila clavipes]